VNGELMLQVGRIRAAWPILTERLQPGREHREERAPDPAALAARDRLLVAERADRWRLVRDRTTPTGQIDAPVAVDVVDVRAQVDRVVSDVAVELWRVGYGYPLRVEATTTDRRVPVALDAITDAAARVRYAPLVLDAADRLAAVATVAERAAGTHVPPLPLRGRSCPACGSESLRMRREAPRPADWVIECRRAVCMCRSGWCGCRGVAIRPVEAIGRRHVWGRAEWGALSELVGVNLADLAETSCASR
jgi:hypothetical protein